jgi:DNA end-binding protein Ku
MAARSIWQGNLIVQKNELPIKLYSAVQDRQIHFHLIHKRDRTRVQQRMVDAQSERAVPLHEARKAYEAEPGVYVVVTPEEVEQSVPETNRNVVITSFVPTRSIDPAFFDRPYFLGAAGESDRDYFALAQALETKKCSGIAVWVMRKHYYVGALIAHQGYLMLCTLRHSGEVVLASQLGPPPGRALSPREREMARKLIDSLSGPFQPETYHDEYEARIHELIAAKKSGKKVKPKRAQRRLATGSLADSLQASLKSLSAGRSA